MIQPDKRVQKRRQGIAALILIVLLSTTGTFAFNQMQQRAINTLWSVTNYGGRIHDNFDGFRGYQLEADDIRLAALAQFDENGEGMRLPPAHFGGAGDRNKDIYAENFGEHPIYVRIRLLEFLAFDGIPINDDWSVDDPHGQVGGNEEWSVFISDEDDVFTRSSDREETYAGAIGDYGIEWTLGHDDDDPKYFMPTFNRATHEAAIIGEEVPMMFRHENAFIMTDATGYAIEWLSARNEVGRAVPEHGEIEHSSDFAAVGQQSAPGLNQERHRFYDGFGLHNNWRAGQSMTSERLITQEFSTAAGIAHELVLDARPDVDADFEWTCYEWADEEEEECEEYDISGIPMTTQFTHYAMETMRPSIDEEVTDEEVLAVLGLEERDDFNGVMTIRNWEELGRPEGNFWIHDTEDGWFYWNGLLLPGEDPRIGETNATSLLLNEISVPQFSRSWEYVIVVDGEFFTGQSLPEDRSDESDYIFNRVPEPELRGPATVGGRGWEYALDSEGNNVLDDEGNPVRVLTGELIEGASWDWDPELEIIVVKIPASIIGDRNPNDVIDVRAGNGPDGTPWTHSAITRAEDSEEYRIIFTPPGPWCRVNWDELPITVRQGDEIRITPDTAVLECHNIRADLVDVLDPGTGEVIDSEFQHIPWLTTSYFELTGTEEGKEGLVYDSNTHILTATLDTPITLPSTENRYITVDFHDMVDADMLDRIIGPLSISRPILVTPASPVTATACRDNGYFIDGDVVWCSMGISEDGYELVISYNTHNLPSAAFGSNFAAWDDEPAIRTAVQTWFNNNSTADLRSATANATGFGTETPVAAGEGAAFGLNGAISSPVAGTAGTGTAFLPSMAEIAQFAGHTGAVTFGAAHSAFTEENIGGSQVGMDRFGAFWLRSVSITDFNDADWAWVIYSDLGDAYATETTETGVWEDYGVRPSIWIRTSEITWERHPSMN